MEFQECASIAGGEGRAVGMRVQKAAAALKGVMAVFHDHGRTHPPPVEQRHLDGARSGGNAQGGQAGVPD